MDSAKGGGSSFIYLAGQRIAEDHWQCSTDTHTVTYFHTDALGSPVATTDATGNVLERTYYAPYGEALNRTVDGPGYTGHVMDAATGLVYAQQRYYDPVVGKFLSIDPVAADPSSGGNFNRYWYANDNPYKFTDPTGRAAANTCSRVGATSCSGSFASSESVAVLPAVKAVITSRADRAEGKVAQSAGDVFGGFLKAQEEFIKAYVEGIAEDGPGAIAAGPVGPLLRFRQVVNAVQVGRFRLTSTVARRGQEVIMRGPFSGELARPFIGSPNTIEQIIATGRGVPDPGGAAGALRFDAPGTFRGVRGTFELVIQDDLVLHFNFVK